MADVMLLLICMVLIPSHLHFATVLREQLGILPPQTISLPMSCSCLLTFTTAAAHPSCIYYSLHFRLARCRKKLFHTVHLKPLFLNVVSRRSQRVLNEARASGINMFGRQKQQQVPWKFLHIFASLGLPSFSCIYKWLSSSILPTGALILW